MPRSANPDRTKFLQICASHDDLFALDEEGEVYQYNFNAKTWMKLLPSRRQPTALGGEPEAENGRPRKPEAVSR
jgi:hypothetical protein